MTTAFKAIMIAAALAAMMAITLSCSRGTPPTAGRVDLGEFGTWTWVMSVGGVAGDTIKADSVDYTRQLVYDTTGDFRTYRLLRDGFIEAAGNYILSPPTATRSTWAIHYDDERVPAQSIDRLDTDTLVLSPLTVIDGFTEVYAR